MPKKRKDCVKITCKCDNATHYEVAIAERTRIEEFKLKLLKSIVDFVDINTSEIKISFAVEETTEQPEEGTDIFIKPVNQHVEERKSEIDVIDLE